MPFFNTYQKFDNLVIGGGIVGVSIAYHLSKNEDNKNSKTVLLEKNAIGSGATTMSAGTIAACMNPENTPNPKLWQPFMAMHSIKTILEVEKLGYKTSFHQSGEYTFATNKNSYDYLKTMHAFAEREGLVSKWVDLNELRKTLPNVSKNCLGATFSELSGQVVPGVLAEAIASACRANGVVVIEGEEVVRVEKRGVWGLFDGYHYKTVTNANSYLSRNIIKAEGACNSKTVPVKGHIMIGKVQNMPNTVFYCSDAYAEWSTWSNASSRGLSLDQNPTHIYGKVLNNEIMIGGGRKLIDDSDSSESMHEIEPLETESILKKARFVFDGLEDFVADQVYTGIMPFTEDKKVMIDREEDVWTVNGMASSGIMHGPGLAKFVAEWVKSGDKPGELSFLDDYGEK